VQDNTIPSSHFWLERSNLHSTKSSASSSIPS